MPVLYNDIVTLFAKSGVAYTPTLIVAYGALSGEFYWYQHMNVWEHERLLQFMPRDVVDPRSRRRIDGAEDDFGHVIASQSAKQLADAGVLVNMGAHGQLQGLGAHWEMWMLAQGGMTPIEVLRAATINPAIPRPRQGARLDRAGQARRSRRARSQSAREHPQHRLGSPVMLNGRLYDAATMNEVGNHPRTRPSFPWQRK